LQWFGEKDSNLGSQIQRLASAAPPARDPNIEDTIFFA
jgi:hypothetical protein